MDSDEKVAIVVPNRDFRDSELQDLIDVLVQNGLGYHIVACTSGDCVGIGGTTVTANYSFDQVDAGHYNALALIGGPGTDAYLHNDILHDLIRSFIDQKKIIAAICWAPAILANAGVLSKKNATVWDGAKNELIKVGANYTGEKVTVDGNFITADGPDSAVQFAEQLVSMLTK